MASRTGASHLVLKEQRPKNRVGDSQNGAPPEIAGCLLVFLETPKKSTLKNCTHPCCVFPCLAFQVAACELERTSQRVFCFWLGA